MAQRLPPQGRIQSLDALRGLAALAVAWFHITHGGKIIDESSQPLLQTAASFGLYGHHGITLFFVLSGFVIPLSMQRTIQGFGVRAALHKLPRFMLPRLVRLWPPFVAANVLAIGLNWISTFVPGYRGQFQATPYQAAFSLSSDSLFITGLLGGVWILVVAWTLALEVQFYFIAGLVEPITASARRHRPLPIMFLGLISISLLCWVFPSPSLVFSVLPAFALGWVSAHQHLTPSRFDWLGIAWLLVLIAARTGFEQSGVAALCVALIAFAARFPEKAPKPLLWLGGISYSLFLTHVPIGGRVVNLLLRSSLPAAIQVLVCLLALALSLLVAWMFWALVERPCHRLSRKVLQAS